MRKGTAAFLALIVVLGIIGLTGCEKGQEPVPFPFVGSFPIEGYAPQKEDLEQVPYSYRGESDHFSIFCTIWQDSSEERSALIIHTQALLEQIKQEQKNYPERDYTGLLEKVERDLSVLQEREDVYFTQVRGRYAGEPKEEAFAQYAISQGETVYLSALVFPKGVETTWVTLANTGDGSYTQGVLLPCEEEYEMRIQYGDVDETLLLERQ